MLRIILIFIISGLFVYSHGGRTDSNGGHNDNVKGGYHYHHGCSAHQHRGGCPYDYRNCRNEGGSSYNQNIKSPNFFWDNFYLFFLGGFLLLILYAYLMGIIDRQRAKQIEFKKEKKAKAKRHDIYLHLRDKQYYWNKDLKKWVKNPLTNEETHQYNDLKKEFESKLSIIKKFKSKSLIKVLKDFIEQIFFYLRLDFIKIKWLRVILVLSSILIYFFLFIWLYSWLIGSIPSDSPFYIG